MVVVVGESLLPPTLHATVVVGILVGTGCCDLSDSVLVNPFYSYAGYASVVCCWLLSFSFVIIAFKPEALP